MTVRLTYCDTKLTSVDDLVALRANTEAAGLEIVVLQSTARHPLWRNAHAHTARALGLIVAAGGAPAAGTLMLTSLAADVVRSDALALATPADQRRRTAVAITVAPGGRADDGRWLFVGTDLTGEEWRTHRDELRQRLGALGHPANAATLVFAVDHKVMQLPSLDQPDQARPVNATSGEGGALVFDIDL
ncbi:hypothetical protein CLV47_110101 [Antricoccus suffuscus]|uniref:Uncharacterized protein n=1 Tax=Antricoccus suffuscus TaxID=1629062 RepID=A0A2T0ZYG3_9ACTN|nr:hypothetical protein [Antricoccus suffuscus]PRZ41373.1 hypothetical protein CLV47_110101 [Antricoccus suffuscus]